MSPADNLVVLAVALVALFLALWLGRDRGADGLNHPGRTTGWIVLTLVVSLAALLQLLRPGPWIISSLTVIVVVAAAMGLARRLRAWLAGPAGLAATLLFTTAVTAPERALWGFWPTPAALRQLGRELLAATVRVRTALPLESDGAEFVPLIVLVLGLITLVAVACAVDLGWPAVAGATAVGPWAVLGAIRYDDAFPALALTGLGFAGLLAYGHRRRRDNASAWPRSVVALGLAVALVAPLVALPLLQRTPVWGTGRATLVAWRERLTGASRDGIDLTVGLDSWLGQPNNQVMLRLTPLSDQDLQGTRLRLGVSYDFDGRGWSLATSSWAPGRDLVLLWPEGARPDSSPWLWGDPQGLTVEQVSLQAPQDRLPLTTGPKTAVGLEPFYYDAKTDSARRDGGLAPGTGYQLLTWPLRRDQLAWLTADPAAADPRASAAVAIPHTDQLTALAQGIVAGQRSDLGRAQALVDYLTGPGFVYDRSVPASTGDDPVWDFLQRRSGYCVHYATAFALMARAVGLPVRLAVGFASGRPLEGGRREIRGLDAHAWPEVYFEGAGWVAFEPTPGLAEALTAAVEPTPEPTAAEPTPEPTATALPDDAAESPAAAWGWRWLGIGLLVGLVLSAALLGRWQWRRRADLETVWRSVSRRLWRADRRRSAPPHRWSLGGRAAVGLGSGLIHRFSTTEQRLPSVDQGSGQLPVGLSPGALARRLAVDLGLDPESRAALFRLSQLVEDRRYGPPADQPPAEEADAWARQWRRRLERPGRRPPGTAPGPARAADGPPSGRGRGRSFG
ncbi:MAG: transglutaminaseTgpA domain-containing protein [Propionibacteriaceae bacterium]|jgi:transglutaminase-like putative cysteine protease|nr:transglutaminaseTgpA domain-containing protein [Propionibacteriaceae bacterium]